MFINTMNKMGYATDKPDLYSQNFIDYASTQTSPVLEIGAAYGVVTHKLLQQDAKIYMNDLSSDHLQKFWDSLNEGQQKRITLCPGYFPDDFSFPSDFFGAILACRILHLLPPEDLKNALDYIYKILKPGGKFFFVTDTPYLKFLSHFLPTYEQRLSTGIEFPGFIEDSSQLVGSRAQDIPLQINFLGYETVERVFAKTKFKIRNVEYINQKNFPEDIRLDGRESLGLIAYKN